MTQDRVRLAIEQGRRQAQDVLAFRAEQLALREEVLRSLPPEAFPLVEESASFGLAVDAAGSPPRGVLVAEGDSWFDYPRHDVLRMLEDRFGYEVETVASKGDRVEEMAYTDGQLEELTRLLEKLLRRRARPQAILLSGGGNDVAGKEFGMLLNHADSPVKGLNLAMLDGLFSDRIALAYIKIIQAVTDVCIDKTGAALPIVLHGYDRPVPDGRGFIGGWWFLPGPWLEPGFREKGYTRLDERIEIAADLIDRFNVMMAGIAAMPEFPHVRYVDVRGALSNDPADYRNWWANELHPTEEGFFRVADRIAAVL